jgi:dTDP-4-dehydrorhamnose 3,5-epimerase
VPYTVEATAIPEVQIIRPRVYPDERGWFSEVLQVEAFAALGLGLPTRFVQVNQSRSVRGVVRGLHFQWDPPQGKLMRVVAGRAFMVAVDIRPGSPTLGKAVSLEATADEPVLFWAPASFARGFAALSDVAEIEYFCTAPYNPACETGIRWDDPVIGIEWPVAEPRLSPRDAAAGTLADWLARPESAAFRSGVTVGSTQEVRR